MGFTGGDAREAKVMAMDFEARSWGSIIDIDVIGPEGTIHGVEFGRGPRKCMLCDSGAKECARERKHGTDKLRAVASRLLVEGIRDLSVSG